MNATRFCFKLALAIAFGLCATHIHAQGCAQCLDATHATPPAVQAAYRHAIYLLAGTATALFIAGIALLRRQSRPPAVTNNHRVGLSTIFIESG